jgi:hypothetical protein
MVIELPPGAYIGLVDDHHQRWVMDMGIPGPDEGRGGKHVVLGPGYDGEVPDGYHVGRSSSHKALVAVRALPAGGDLAAAMDALRAVRIHRLSDPAPIEIVDTTERDVDCTCLRWEDNLEFWEVLHRIVDAEPLVDEFRPMYGMLADLGIRAGAPFAPDDRMAGILEQAARAGRAQLLVSAFASAREDRIAWPDRQWEWVGLVPCNADFETPSGLDLEARDRWFAQAIVASPAMFRRTVGGGSLYWARGARRGGRVPGRRPGYSLTVPLPVPGKQFWSLTVYEAETRSQVRTDQDKAALRSLFELRDIPESGTVDLVFGPAAPADAESRWIKTLPGRGWFAYLRIYGPEQPAFDGSWKPGDFTAVG